MLEAPSPNAELDRPTTAPSSPSNRYWSETVLSVFAIVIAAISLWVAIDTEKTNQQLISEAAWPYLQVYNSAHGAEGQPALSLNVANAGIGPAKIVTLELFWNGKPYSNSDTLLKACCGVGAELGLNQRDRSSSNDGALGTSAVAGSVLRAGDVVPIIRYVRTLDNASAYQAFDRARDKITYRVCYCSVFNQCWRSTGRDLNPSVVKVCPEPAAPYSE